MKIGIIGLGIVGSACKTGFEYCKYNVYVHDLKLNSKIEDVLQTEIVYICVPTPSNNNLCDTSIVESVIHNLYNLNYQGIIAIKSTIPPGTTQALIEKYDDRILFVPEFLKERSAEYDFKFDHKLLLVGTENVNHYYVVIRSHSDLPKDIQRISPTEAELTKYYHNSFNATRIVFANIFFELCSKLNVDYDKVKESFLKYSNMPDEYLDVKPELRGYGGACLPKDVSALQGFCEQLNLPYDFFENLNIENKKFKTTVFKGMRK